MNDVTFGKILVVVFMFYISVCFVALFSKAYADSIYKESDVYDLWTVDQQQFASFSLYNYLNDKGMIADGVSFTDFDYIYVLTQQLCSMTKNVTPELALSIISVESNFDTNAKTGSARGLMQLIPIYHSKRMESYVENGHLIDLDDFFNPRLNIATGLDYFDYILKETNNDLTYALMWYNQGSISASKDYIDYRKISPYARTVENLSEVIKSYLEGGCLINVCYSSR